MQLLIIIANRTPSISGTQRALTCSSLRKNVIYVLWYSLESQKIPFMLLVEMQFIANYLCDTPTSHSRNVVHTYHQGTWQIRPSFLKAMLHIGAVLNSAQNGYYSGRFHLDGDMTSRVGGVVPVISTWGPGYWGNYFEAFWHVFWHEIPPVTQPLSWGRVTTTPGQPVVKWRPLVEEGQ